MVAEAKKIGILEVSPIQARGFDNVIHINFVKSEYYKHQEMVLKFIYLLKIAMVAFFAILFLFFTVSSIILEYKNSKFIAVYNKTYTMQIKNNAIANEIYEKKSLYNISDKVVKAKTFSEPLQVIHLADSKMRRNLGRIHHRGVYDVQLPLGY